MVYQRKWGNTNWFWVKQKQWKSQTDKFTLYRRRMPRLVWAVVTMQSNGSFCHFFLLCCCYCYCCCCGESIFYIPCHSYNNVIAFHNYSLCVCCVFAWRWHFLWSNNKQFFVCLSKKKKMEEQNVLCFDETSREVKSKEKKRLNGIKSTWLFSSLPTLLISSSK